MSEIEHEIQQEAAEVAAEVGGTAGAIAAEHVAAHAAEEAVAEAVEHVEELVEHVEELADNTKEDERWARMQAAQMESENRIIQGMRTAIADGLRSLSASPWAEPTTTETAPDPAATLEEISEELSEAAEEMDDGGAEPAAFDPLSVDGAPEASAKSRRRLVGRGKRPSA